MRSHNSRKLAATFAVGIFVLLILCGACLAQSFVQEYLLHVGQTNYRLNLSITPSLFEYYQQKNHQLTQRNFASFVTPYSMALVAEDIRSIFLDEEDFVNGVLMLVHQIPYTVIDDGRYPVETIAENAGDCDVLSYVAASLIKAQNLDVVLLYYEHESHMNVGVSLLTPPGDVRTQATYVEYNGIRYYVAECTGENWRTGWRVGECPPELEGASVEVVTLENCETVAPGQVSSSFSTFESSALIFSVSPRIVMEGGVVTMNGQVQVSTPNGTVTFYGTNGGDWFIIGAVELNLGGSFAFSWSPTLFGQCYVRASWPGDADRSGADSDAVSLIVIPRVVVIAGGFGAVLGVGAVVLLLLQRSTHNEEI
ncbi:MAG: Ig-like domain-containing protein, partial [Candidatus Bathyarchaeota archaeon]|nr:Ig-like domain-containing protein [Candidatus Bathyarchaeota archaeon]